MSILNSETIVAQIPTESNTTRPNFQYNYYLAAPICNVITQSLKKGVVSRLLIWHTKSEIARIIKGRNNGQSFTKEFKAIERGADSINPVSSIQNGTLESRKRTVSNGSSSDILPEAEYHDGNRSDQDGNANITQKQKTFGGDDSQDGDIEGDRTSTSAIRLAHEAEWGASAIHHDLFQNCITYESNRDILNTLLVGEIERTNTGRASRYYLDLYGHFNSGWSVETLGSDYIQFKPDEQYRRLDKEGKPIKYENPPKHPSDIFRLKYIPTWLARQLGCDVESQQFWEWVNRGECKRLIVTEGAKKAASLLSHGKVAIGLCGINNLYNKDEKGNKKPIPALVEAIKNKEEITLCLDAPEKLTQISPLNAANNNLKDFILKYNPKCKINIVVWDWWLGKGIDDVIAAGHLDKVRVLPYYEALRFINTNIPACKPPTTGKEYLDAEIVDNFRAKYIAIKADKNSGKSYLIGKYLGEIIDLDFATKILNITHRIKLGRSQADKWGIYYLSEETKDAASKAAKNRAISLCINSLSEKNINPEDWKDVIVILDEFVQVMAHIINSGTLKNAPEILNNFRTILLNARQIILADEALDFKSLKFLDEILGEEAGFLKNIKIYEFKKEAPKMPMTLHKVSNKSVVARTYNEIISQLLNGKKVLGFVDAEKASSKLAAETLVQAAKKEYFEKTGKELKALAMYSRATKNQSHDASKIAGNIEKLYDYDLVIYTSVMGTGVSLEKPHFDVVIGGFVGCLSVDEVLQGLYRYRLPVPRIVFLPNKGMQFKRDGSDYSSKANKFNTKKVKQHILALYPLLASEIPESDDGINQPIQNLYAKLRAIGKLESDNYFNFFTEKASREYEINASDVDVNISAPEIIKETVTEILQIEGERISKGIIVDDTEYEEMKAAESLPQPKFNNYEKTKLAKKYELEAYEELVNPELFTINALDQDYLSGLKMHYFIDNPENANLAGEIRLQFASFDIDKYKGVPTIKAALMRKLGADKLRTNEILHKSHPIVKDIIAKYNEIESEEKGIIRLHLNIGLNPKKVMDFIESLALKQGMVSESLGKKSLPSGERINQVRFSFCDEMRYSIFKVWNENWELRKIENESIKVQRDIEFWKTKILEKSTEFPIEEMQLIITYDEDKISELNVKKNLILESREERKEELKNQRLNLTTEEKELLAAF